MTNKHTATAPDGTTFKRNSADRTYNWAVLTCESVQNQTDANQANIKRVAQSMETAKAGSEWMTNLQVIMTDLFTRTYTVDKWTATAWRRELHSAEQEANRLAKFIPAGHISAAIVVKTEIK